MRGKIGLTPTKNIKLYKIIRNYLSINKEGCWNADKDKRIPWTIWDLPKRGRENPDSSDNMDLPKRELRRGNPMRTQLMVPAIATFRSTIKLKIQLSNRIIKLYVL